MRNTNIDPQTTRYELRATSYEIPNTLYENRESSYLRAYKAEDIYVPIRHYICREPSTNQLLFMQNKPNFKTSQMNVNPYNKTNYENISNWTLGENKPNSNPIQTQFAGCPNERKFNINKALQKKRRFVSPKKQTQNKPNFRKAKK